MKYVRDILVAIRFALGYLYEDCKLYKLNPCDVGSFGWLVPLGRALQKFGSHCQCCSGSRVVFLVAVMAAIPAHGRLLATVIFCVFIAVVLYEYYRSYRAKTWRFEQEV